MPDTRSPPRRWTDTAWSQWVYPGPKRVFTAEELARAGEQPWPAMLERYVLFNAVFLLGMGFASGSRMEATWMFCAGLAMAIAGLAVGRWLWRQPSRWRLNMASLAAAVVFWVVVLVAARLLGRDTAREIGRELAPHLAWIVVATVSAWWALTVYRAHQIEARLRELAEQDAALRLSTRLATAQIQPHFLFNTLASLQHWVDTGDARAAPLLRDFTAYLRATLPMFERELQPLADEIEMVRRYLAIMQARLGARLAFHVDVPAGDTTPLPPGIVLTLVENAIGHGIEPQLRGGRIDIAARHEGGRLVLTVRDDGPGLAPGCADGVGLANTRRRLAQACPGATLTLTPADPGCLATLTL
jgi:signal transduction histidine kinase